MSERRWVARKEKVNESEFDEARRCLLNSYHSYVQNHAGYIIAITIGLLTLVSNFESFFNAGPAFYTFKFSTSISLKFTLGFMAFLVLIVLIAIAFSHMILRIEYWTYFADGSLNLTLDKAILFFNYYNSSQRDYPYFTEAPCMAILQTAITQQFRIIKPRIFVSSEMVKGLAYWIKRKRKTETDLLIEEATEDIKAKRWREASNKLKVAFEFASYLKDKARQGKIQEQQKEIPKGLLA